MSDLTRNNFHNRHGDHVTPWLSAYFDGEVTVELREQIEAHLANCQECQAELAGLTELSSLLHCSPPPVSRTSDAAFARQVVNQLTRPQAPLWQRNLNFVWRFAPLFLFTAWAFFQAVKWVSAGVAVGLALFPGAGEVFHALLPENGGAGALLFEDLLRMGILDSMASQAIEQISWLTPLGLALLVNLVILGVLAALFASWLASWWVYHTRHQMEGIYNEHQ